MPIEERVCAHQKHYNSYTANIQGTANERIRMRITHCRSHTLYYYIYFFIIIITIILPMSRTRTAETTTAHTHTHRILYVYYLQVYNKCSVRSEIRRDIIMSVRYYIFTWSSIYSQVPIICSLLYICMIILRIHEKILTGHRRSIAVYRYT